MDDLKPNWSSAALLVIDMQNDFAVPGGAAYIEGTKEVITATQSVVTAFRAAGRPIVHVVRLYLADGSNVDLVRRKAIATGALSCVRPYSIGADVVRELKPQQSSVLDPPSLLASDFQQWAAGEWVMYKPRWGAFFKTQLDLKLGSMGVDTVVVAGCNFPNCPRATVYEASERDFRIVVVRDAVSRLSEDGVADLKAIGTAVLTAAEVEAALQSQPLAVGPDVL